MTLASRARYWLPLLPLLVLLGATYWLNQQVQYDLWHAERKRKKLRVQKLSAA